MACLPLIERELRVALRKQRPARGRLKIAAIATGGSMLFVWFGSLTHFDGAGRGLEKLLCAAGLVFVMRVPGLTAGVLAEERRNQTLGLLFLSGLSPGEVFAGKFFSSTLIAFTDLLAIFPMLALPFLIGGVSYNLFLAIVCGLPVLMLFALAVSLLASVMKQEDAAAVILANTLGALLCVFGPAIYLAQSHLSGVSKPSLWWLRLSPGYGPWLVWHGFDSGFRSAEREEFWQNLVLTLAWSVLALAAAAFTLKRVWREQEDEANASGWRKRWREILHGDLASRRRIARLHLDKNPFVWLVRRDRQMAALGWIVAGAVALAWLLCWAVWGLQLTTAPNFFLTAVLLNVAIGFISRHAAAQAVGQPRRDGSLELLLTTPLRPNDIVWGTLEALRRQFKPLANFVLSLEALMMLCGLATRQWSASALTVYFSVWLFLMVWSWDLGRRWSRALPVMWVSLNCGRPTYAVQHISGPSAFNHSHYAGARWLYWLWALAGPVWISKFRQFPTGATFEVVVVGIFVSVYLLMWLPRRLSERGNVYEFLWDPEAKAWLPAPFTPEGKSAKLERTIGNRLISDFREIAQEPLPERNDARFKKWNVHGRFPR